MWKWVEERDPISAFGREIFLTLARHGRTRVGQPCWLAGKPLIALLSYETPGN